MEQEIFSSENREGYNRPFWKILLSSYLSYSHMPAALGQPLIFLKTSYSI